MATSQIVPFAIAPGANVQDLASYTAASATASGFSAGVANSAALNRAWRQSSFMAAGLAGLLAANGVDALDDGDLAALVAKLTGLFGSTTRSQKLPGGLILQWGLCDLPPVSVTTFPLSVAFPSAFYGAVVSVTGTTTAAAGTPFVGCLPRGLSQIDIQSLYTSSYIVGFYVAIGR